ncbi:hypothetical protein DWB61_05530 [Ancylomarina euxinus]|uniref:Uncharacterized protein n=1 Tax=Ancylomarina euxinus TaxID=2283627 RepID=A0A425Y3P8_9BACT|nr:hypothetical protein [Ancylomarina euxinus]MCZ4694497.1 hypothetical protein [Ancylomarina euxinus]MUP14040.1 hypothetical protein [Ancylomarina euxinus]RRG22900.1 hypothetical protein DWB61_05530 [Ancylomarina euxinus]
MSDQQKLLDLLPEIKAVPKEQIKQCDMPIGIYLQESENLHTRASADLAFLTTVGMTAELLDKLLSRIGALSTAESNWAELNTVREDAKEIWKAEWPAFLEFREDLIDHMDFAYRNNEALISKVAAIKEGDSQADAIQDMSNLSVLGKANLAPLDAINYDTTLLDKAGEDANKMRTLLGDVNGHMYVADETKVVRDQAFTLLKVAVDEVRNYGRFVFRKNVEHVRSYSSKHARDKGSAYRRRQAEEAEKEA